MADKYTNVLEEYANIYKCLNLNVKKGAIVCIVEISFVRNSCRRAEQGNINICNCYIWIVPFHTLRRSQIVNHNSKLHTLVTFARIATQ